MRLQNGAIELLLKACEEGGRPRGLAFVGDECASFGDSSIILAVKWEVSGFVVSGDGPRGALLDTSPATTVWGGALSE